MAINIAMEPSHPGHFIKRSVLPDDLNVTDTAKFLQIGRPALSNFLNGKASLSAEMALRLEAAFEISAETLMRMQARYDAYHARKTIGTLGVKSYFSNPGEAH